MKVNVIDFAKEKSAQIYISNQEEIEETVQNKIEELKSKYKNIAVFISGKGDTKEKIEKIVSFQNNLQN